MKITKKIFVLCAMLMGLSATLSAQTWTWTGENPTAGGDFYIYHPNSGIFLNHQNKTGNNLAAGNLDNAFVWTVTYLSVSNNIYTVNLKSGSYWFNLAKSGTSNANPNLSNSKETIQLSASSTNTSIKAYKIHRTVSPARYLNYNNSSFTGAQNTSEQNDWCFITATQVTARKNYIATYNKAVAYGVSSDILDANNTANSSNVASKIEALENAIATKLASTNLSNSLNLTGLIVNPGFEETPWNKGWTTEGFGEHGNDGKFVGSHIAQMWCDNTGATTSGSITQTLTNLPQGMYKLRAKAVSGTEGTSDIFAQTTTAKLTVNVPWTDGDVANYYEVMFSITSGDNNQVTIGFERNACHWWTACDDWTLTYYGTPNTVSDNNWTGKYLYTTTNTDGDVAFGRGANWGTQAIPTNDGGILLDINITNGIASIKYADTNKYLFDASGYNIFTDAAAVNTTTQFIAVNEDDGYKFILASDPTCAIGIGTDAINPAYAERDDIDKNTEFDVLKLVNVNDAPVWKIADAKAKMNVSANKYGTFVAPFDVKLPSGVSAYTVESVTKRSEVTLTDLQDQTLVPAKTPVVLKNESAAVETTFYGIDQRVEEDGVKPYYVENGLLRGYFVDKDNEDNKLSLEGDGHTYVMQTLNERQSFYIIGQGKTYYVTKNKCYLITPEDSQDAQMIKLGFDDEDNETGLDAITVFDNDKSSVVIYDLNGRRVNKMQKGIYIINGKKIIK